MSQPPVPTWKKAAKKLVTPLAIGIYLAIIGFGIAFRYYEAVGRNEYRGLMGALSDLDQKSIDYRLKMRGLRQGSPDVAVLAVDDRSLDIVGRWPWPREVLGRAVENAFKNGSKVVANDVVFSEPSHRAEVELMKNIESKNTLPENLKSAFAAEMEKLDSDKLFGEIVGRIKDGYILGNFSNDGAPIQGKNAGYGFPAACNQLIFDESLSKKIWNNDSILIAATDPFEPKMPSVIAEAYKMVFKSIEEAVTAANPPAASAKEAYALNAKILEAKQRFCVDDFLDPANDANFEVMSQAWPQVRDADKSIAAASFNEWAESFKDKFSLYNLVPEKFDWVMNIPTITNSATNNGYFNAVLERDGTIRQTMLISRTGNFYMPSIALKAFLLAQDANPNIVIDKIPDNPGAKGIIKLQALSNETGDVIKEIPVKPDGHMIINYAGPRHTFAHISIADLLDESSDSIQVIQQAKNEQGHWESQMRQEKKAEYLKNKVLVLGATAVGVFDLRVTPFDENFPGVETHANVIDNLIRSDFLHISPKEHMIMPFIVLIIGLLSAWMLTHVGALSGIIYSVVTLVILALFDKFLLFGKGTLVSIMFPLLQTSSSYIIMTFYKYLTEERNKKELRATFSKYVSPAIVEEVLKDPKNLELGGRKENITVFFSDLRGFTTFSEKLDPQGLSELLNKYLTPMTDLVFKNKGTLDKYMGDAIMAFFGAPIHYKDHAKSACQCALQHLERLKELQKEVKAQFDKLGLPNLDMGIGLNTGEASVGNMGSQTVRNYTVMGDTVNLASRLEGINKSYGTHIIISEFTYAQVKDDFLCREVDWVRVKGKTKPVKIFELLAEGKPAGNVIEMAKYFSDGYENYHKRLFDKAIHIFGQALKQNPQDETSKIYIERCQDYMEEPPPENWDGVYNMKTK